MSDKVIYTLVDEKVAASEGIEHDRPAWRSFQCSKLRDNQWLTYLWLFWETMLVLMVVMLAVQLHRATAGDVAGNRIDQWHVDSKMVLFMNDSTFANKEMWSSIEAVQETLKHWAPISNTGRGMVRVDTDERDGLDPPYLLNPFKGNPLRPSTTEETYMMSGFHQLHCLSTIMYSYAKIRLGRDEDHNGEHVAHCFDYLRQGIMCAGDITLEGNASARYPGVVIPWGAHHKCKDWSQIIEWADERIIWEFSNNSGIL